MKNNEVPVKVLVEVLQPLLKDPSFLVGGLYLLGPPVEVTDPLGQGFELGLQ